MCADSDAGSDWLALGRLRAERGDRRSARAAFERCSGTPELLLEATRALADLALRDGEPEQAYALIAAAHARTNSSPAFLADLAFAAEHCARPQEALALYGDAIAANPADARARQGRAALLRRRGEHALALVDYEVLTAAPDAATAAWHAKAECLRQLGRSAEAVAACDQALARDPAHQPSRLCKAVTLAAAGNTVAAQHLFDRVFADEPATLQRYAGSSEVPSAPPDARAVHLVAGFAALTRAEWTDYAALLSGARSYFANAASAPSDLAVAFPTLYLPLTPAESSTAHTAVARAITARLPAPVRAHPAPARARLHVAYISTKFRDHPAMFLTRGLFRAHDRERFEVSGYALNADDGGAERRLMSAEFDRVVDLSGLDDDAAAARIASARTDILVDLNGYGDDARPGVLARRPAALQMTFIGHLHSLFAPWIDYRVTDRIAEPEDWGRPLLEKRVFMPRSLFPYGAAPAAPATELMRAALGLPAAAFVLCAFTRIEKIEPHGFAVWMEIMRAVPHAVLWLLDPGAPARSALADHARHAGVAPERLVFAPRLPHAQHLLRHRAADLYLDTFVFNAHTTGLDALHAGLPMVTLRGASWASRVGASFLSALGLTELITHEAAAYRDQVIALARQPQRLDAVTRRLRTHIRDARPFASERATRDLERAYTQMWAWHVRGIPPRDIHLET